MAEILLPRYPRGTDYAPIGFSCNVPSNTLNIDSLGNCFLCVCEAWLPITVGNILSFNSLDDIWNCTTAKYLQDDVIGGKFTYCAVKHCGVTNGNKQSVHYRISVNIDESCNLACPSCRTEQINHTKGLIFEEKNRYVDHFISLLEKFDKPLQLTMCGNGDPLASMTFRPLVLGWVPKVGQTVKLFTNGLLMKKFLPTSTILKHVKKFQISVDAGSQSVYEVVRWPGKFAALQTNLQWLSENTDSGTDVDLHFCISKNNATDIINFADMVKKYNFRGTISKLDDWGTFADFDEYDVIGNINHPLREQVLSDLSLVMDEPHISMNNFLLDVLER